MSAPVSTLPARLCICLALLIKLANGSARLPSFTPRNNINGILISDEAKISQFVADFYQQFYTSSFHSDSSKLFFSEVEQFIPNINEDNYTACEGEITVEEMDSLITKTPFNKSPGPDGLPFEFCRSVWNDIKYFI
ncbi:LINE-1 retrotransposable element ORF2 protein [Labeo rohita]|uniref:LINE-1 retrotransposable element ORF2 protein n=1 Tax=Labeo rohita TaxID=84645 RepID=A0ABQ8MEM7_LABRO|nr:LINE-1 retrotransposable element ORF2 protein [Labeo rohita]